MAVQYNSNSNTIQNSDGSPLDVSATPSQNSNVISVDSLSTTPSVTPPPLPPPPAQPNHAAIIAGTVPPPAPAPDTTISTPATDASTGLLASIKSLMGLDTGKAAYTQEQLDTSGATALTAHQNEITAQLNSLNDEAQAIPLKTEQGFAGTGATTGGVAPITSGQLKDNAIKALTLKSEYDLNAGNLATATANAQRAVDLKYSDVETQIDQQSKLLTLYAPFMSAEQKAQADQKQQELDQQKTDLATKKQQQQDVINTAQTNGDAKSASAALSLDPNSSTFTQDLAKIQASVAPKATDPLDAQYKQLQIQKLQQDINDAKTTGAETVAIPNDDGSIVNIPTNVAPYYNTSNSGIGYIDASTLQGTAAEKTQIINQAQAAGLKVITNKNTAADLVNIKDASAKLNDISTIMAGIGQPGWVSRALGGAGLTKLSSALQSDPQKAAAGALQSIGLDVLKAISGIQGFRGNASAIQQVTDHLPKTTDTVDTINQKISYIQTLVNDRENAIVGKAPTTKATVPSSQIPDGYYQASDGLIYKK